MDRGGGGGMCTKIVERTTVDVQAYVAHIAPCRYPSSPPR